MSARGPAPRHRDHRRRARATSTSTRACSGCGWSRRPSTSTRPTSTTSTTATRPATPGSILTFFEFPGARRGRAGAGMVHTDPLARRRRRRARVLGRAPAPPRASASRAATRALRFADPEGLEPRLVVDDVADAPLAAIARRHPRRARAAGLPRRARVRARQPAHRARGCSRRSGSSRRQRQRLGRSPASARRAQLGLRPAARRAAASQGAGTIHHIAWIAADDAELDALPRGRRRGRRAADADHRPPVLPLRLLPRAQRRAVRARHRATSASTSTSRSSRSARR